MRLALTFSYSLAWRAGGGERGRHGCEEVSRWRAQVSRVAVKKYHVTCHLITRRIGGNHYDSWVLGF